MYGNGSKREKMELIQGKDKGNREREYLRKTYDFDISGGNIICTS